MDGSQRDTDFLKCNDTCINDHGDANMQFNHHRI